MLKLVFSPVDTWYFREARPTDSAGGGGNAAVFPPAASTLLGAVRTRLGDMLGLDWRAFGRDEADAPAWWGTKTSLGELSMRGPWIARNGDVHFPTPANLVYLPTNKKYVQLLPSAVPIECDLGTVYLPQLPAGIGGAVKTLEETFITEAAYRAVLENGLPTSTSAVTGRGDLFANEQRLGIAVDMSTRSVREGQLYQTVHLRAKDTEPSLVLYLDGIPAEQEKAFCADLAANPLLRLGADGRMAKVVAKQTTLVMPKVAAPPAGAGLRIVLLSDLPCVAGELLPGFKATQEAGVTLFEGQVAGVPLRVRTVAASKPRRRGGWDVAANRPKPMHSYLMAGTTLFCDMPDMPWAKLTELLHGACWGGDDFGQGQVVIGWWKN